MSKTNSSILTGWVGLALLAFAWFGLVQCHYNSGSNEEKYVAVRLNDSLKRYDSVEVKIFVAGDTSAAVGTVWAGPMTRPGSLPDYRLADGEERTLVIRVRAFDADGKLVLNQLISKENGKQVVTTVPIIPVVTQPKPSVRLSALGCSPGSLSPNFEAGRADYVVNLTNAQSFLSFTAVTAYAPAAMTLGTATLVSGQPSARIDLQVGDNNLVLKVYAGTETGTYTIKAVRGPGITHDTTPVVPKDSSLAAWRHSALVTVNVGYLGMGKKDLMRKVPLLIRLKSDFIKFSDAADLGADLRFAKMDGTIMDHEITRWDPVEGKAEVWVSVDSIRGEDQSVQFKMYWGNRSAPSTSDGSKVFNPESGFSGVWHLSEIANGTRGEFKEATGRYPGTAGMGDGNTLPRRVDGVVGNGQDFQPNKVPGTISIPNDFDPGPDTWTFQGWVRIKGATEGVLFSKGDAYLADAQRFQIVNLEGLSPHQLALQRNGAELSTNIFMPDGQWTFLCITFDGHLAQVYIDGVVREVKTWTQGRNGSGKVVFGANDILGEGYSFDGSMDELWFSTQVRSAGWMRLNYENQKVFSNLVILKSLQ